MATLGESPGAVTEAIDALDARGINIDSVCLLTTKDYDAESAANLLAEHIPEHYQGRVTLDRVEQCQAFADLDSQQAVLEFMKIACRSLRDYLRKGTQVYACIAGGRKTMSALLALSVHLYGAAELFHVVAAPGLEEEGKISVLRRFSTEEIAKRLHPATDEVTLVRMPFLGLQSRMHEILQGLKGTKEVSRDTAALLEGNGLLESGTVTAQGKSLLEILEYVESSPLPCPHECIIKLDKSEPKYKDRIESMARKVRQRFPFICRITDGQWSQHRSGVKASGDKALEMFYDSGKDFRLFFLLDTTSTNKGQLEAARREVETWLLQQ